MVMNRVSETQLSGKYRPDIDGLRAIAVFGVVGFHAFPNLIAGGFVGVDVFFVISGYLITDIIRNKLRLGTFSIAEFYSRRIRRIFPALLFVLLICMAFGWFVLTNDELKRLALHVAAGSGFLSNILLWQESGYFDVAAEVKPLLHLWSLGIEEQFYIVWPSILWFAWRYRLNFNYLLIFFVAISFLMNKSEISLDTIATFYSPQTRFWELLSGGMLSQITSKSIDFDVILSTFKLRVRPETLVVSSKSKCDAAFLNSTAAIGLLVVLAAYFKLNKYIAFPGVWAVIPVVGAMLVIFSGPNAWVNKTILANKFMVWIGVISFPLYLVHWPIISFSRIILGDRISSGLILCEILFSALFAWIIYKFVERPTRNCNNSTQILIFSSIVMAGSGLLVFNYMDDVRPTIIDKNEKSVRTAFFKQDGSMPDSNSINCSKSVANYPLSVCSTFKDPNIAIIGDSHAHALYGGFVKLNNKKFRPIVIASASCIPASDVDSTRKECKAFHQVELNMVRDVGIKYVVIASYSDQVNSVSDQTRSDYINGYLKTFDTLRAMGKKVVFVIDNPVLVSDPNICVRTGLWLRDFLNKMPDFCLNPKLSDFKNQDNYDVFVETLRQKRPSVTYFDTKKVLCKNECKIFFGDELLYVEQHHLSIYGSERVVQGLVADIE